MNVLFIADNFPPERNAQASRVYERACYWVRWGHQVRVITCFPNFPEGRLFPGYRNRWRAREQMDGIDVVRVKSFIAANRGILLRTLDFLSFMLTAFWAALRLERPDLVAVTSPQFFAAVGACLAARLRGLPFVLEVSDLWPESIAAVGALSRGPALRLLEQVELWLYRSASRIVVLTQAFERNLVSRGVDPDKIHVVTNGVDLARYQPALPDAGRRRRWGLTDGEFVIGYVGTLGLAHGLANVLDAADRLGGTAVRFLLVGPGAEREALIAERARRGLDNVTILPAQPKEKMPEIWALCDIALVHLRNQPLFETVIPSKMFEAMGMGLPILLAAPAGEASRILLAEGAGVHIEAGDAGALARAARHLAANPQHVSELAARSLAAAPRHSRERQARDALAALEQAVGGKASEQIPCSPYSL
jgi:glycosyltransferase involved in cell wall biosynthesis